MLKVYRIASLLLLIAAFLSPVLPDGAGEATPFQTEVVSLVEMTTTRDGHFIINCSNPGSSGGQCGG